MNELPPSSRIPNEKSSRYHPWTLPEIDEGTNILSSAEKEDRERKELEKLREQEIVGEEIYLEKFDKPLTAEDIADIAESARKQGYEDGYNEGHNQGHQAGLEKGEQQALVASQQQIAQEGERLIAMINALVDPLESHTDRLQHCLLSTIKALTETVVKRELQIDSSHIENLIQQALSVLPVGVDNITISVNPDDKKLLQNFFIERGVTWELTADPKIYAGGCKIKTKESLVDFSVEARLEQLLTEFIAGHYKTSALHQDDNQTNEANDLYQKQKEQHREEKEQQENNLDVKDDTDHPAVIDNQEQVPSELELSNEMKQDDEVLREAGSPQTQSQDLDGNNPDQA